jgi:hypothetical protein
MRRSLPALCRSGGHRHWLDHLRSQGCASALGSPTYPKPTIVTALSGAIRFGMPTICGAWDQAPLQCSLTVRSRPLMASDSRCPATIPPWTRGSVRCDIPISRGSGPRMKGSSSGNWLSQSFWHKALTSTLARHACDHLRRRLGDTFALLRSGRNAGAKRVTRPAWHRPGIGLAST